ncbi:MAG: winged helix-turn-helix domain-containing protein [archaeon]
MGSGVSPDFILVDTHPGLNQEVMHDLLLATEDGIETSELVCSRIASKDKCDFYITELLKRGFIEKQKKRVFMTDKGKKFLDKYKTIRKFVDDFRL